MTIPPISFQTGPAVSDATSHMGGISQGGLTVNRTDAAQLVAAFAIGAVAYWVWKGGRL